MISSRADYSHDQRYFKRISSGGDMVKTPAIVPLWKDIAALSIFLVPIVVYVVL